MIMCDWSLLPPACRFTFDMEDCRAYGKVKLPIASAEPTYESITWNGIHDNPVVYAYACLLVTFVIDWQFDH